jgi:hypothetical protein
MEMVKNGKRAQKMANGNDRRKKDDWKKLKGSSKTMSTTNKLQTKWCHNSEDHNPHIQILEKLKSLL